MSLLSDVTHQVKHHPTCTIHSPFTVGVKKCVCVFFFVWGGRMSSSLVGIVHLEASGGVERGKGYKQTTALAMWWIQALHANET